MNHHKAQTSDQPGVGEHRSHDRDRVPEIFIGGLGSDHTYSHILRRLSEFGKVASLRLMHYHDGQTRGFGFVRFKYQISGIRLLGQRKVLLLGREIECKLALCKDEAILNSTSEMNCKIFVANLKGKVTNDQLEQYFGRYGVVKKVQLITKEYGFVSFEFEQSVHYILGENFNHEINGITLKCKPALSRKEIESFKLKKSELCADQSEPAQFEIYNSDQNGSNFVFRRRSKQGHPKSQLLIMKAFKKGSPTTTACTNRINNNSQKYKDVVKVEEIHHS